MQAWLCMVASSLPLFLLMLLQSSQMHMQMQPLDIICLEGPPLSSTLHAGGGEQGFFSMGPEAVADCISCQRVSSAFCRFLFLGKVTYN